MLSHTIRNTEYRIYSQEEWRAEMMKCLTSGWRPFDISSGLLAGTPIVAEFGRLSARAVVVSKTN